MNTVIVYLILSAVAIGAVLMMMIFASPEYTVKFVRSLPRTIRHALGQPVLTPEQEEAKAQAKKLRHYMALVSRIEQLIPGQTIIFKIREPKTWGGGFITVELNPQYPQTGRKYILSIENMVNGLPGGKRSIIYDSDKLIDLLTSVLDRNGELFAVTGEIPVSAEKVVAGAKKEAIGAQKANSVV